MSTSSISSQDAFIGGYKTHISTVSLYGGQYGNRYVIIFCQM